MAQEALSYTAGFANRCLGLVNGTVAALPTQDANTQSLTQLLTAGGNLFDGLNNALTNRYALLTAEPQAQRIAAVWKATTTTVTTTATAVGGK
jgi:hypothetical protein